jgi:hypothetical protein
MHIDNLGPPRASYRCSSRSCFEGVDAASGGMQLRRNSVLRNGKHRDNDIWPQSTRHGRGERVPLMVRDRLQLSEQNTKGIPPARLARGLPGSQCETGRPAVRRARWPALGTPQARAHDCFCNSYSTGRSSRGGPSARWTAPLQQNPSGAACTPYRNALPGCLQRLDARPCRSQLEVQRLLRSTKSMATCDASGPKHGAEPSCMQHRHPSAGTHTRPCTRLDYWK